MKIFYTASYSGKQKYQGFYNLVLRAIESTHVDLISPEKGNYLGVLSPQERLKLKGKKKIHYEAIRRCILLSDAVIIEISNEDFQLGHEATLTILNKKHVLCLSVHEDFGEKIRNRYFHGAKYNEYNIEELVENFITFVQTDKLSERFNCFLSPGQIHYLEKKSKENKINKSEYLRRLIDEDRQGRL